MRKSFYVAFGFALGGLMSINPPIAALQAFAQEASQEVSARLREDLTAKDRLRVKAVTRPTSDFSKPESFELMQGGAATSKKIANRDAFSQPSANLTFEEEQRFKLGNALFRKLWVSSPASTHASDGLGPLFNARACQSCHIKDGRGHPPEGDSDKTSMFLRLSRPAQTADEEALLADYSVLNFPDPVYGSQLQDLAVPAFNQKGGWLFRIMNSRWLLRTARSYRCESRPTA